MKIKKIAALITAAALTLALAGCGNDDEFWAALDGAGTSQAGGTNSSPFESVAAESEPVESKPTESAPAVQMPDIPVTDASAFDYRYDRELGGVVITNYKLQVIRVHIPDTIEGEKVVAVYFDNVNTEITQLIMPDTVKEFRLSSKIREALKFINIPASVNVRIENYAFGELTSCYDLTSVIIDDGVTAIDHYAFYACSSLTSISIPDSVTQIGAAAFSGCTSLTSITIPDSVTQIGECAFGDCTSLTSITIPDSVTVIGNDAFHDCTSLTAINVANGNSNYFSIEGVLYQKNTDGGVTLIKCPEGKEGGLVIPDSVTKAKDDAFNHCTSLTRITIPDNLPESVMWAIDCCYNEEIVYIYKGKTYENLAMVMGVMKYGEEKGLFYPKVLGADYSAKDLIHAVNWWIDDNIQEGGAEKSACDLRISYNKGTATISERKTSIPGESGSDKGNDWNSIPGRRTESLKEKLEASYSDKTFTATVFIDSSGYVVYSWFVMNIADYNGTAPTGEDFKTGTFNWDGGIDGLLSTGDIVGTSPKILSDE